MREFIFKEFCGRQPAVAAMRNLMAVVGEPLFGVLTDLVKRAEYCLSSTTCRQLPLNAL